MENFHLSTLVRELYTLHQSIVEKIIKIIKDKLSKYVLPQQMKKTIQHQPYPMKNGLAIN